MALIKCNECGKEISDKATNCIHCGYPISNNSTNNKINKKNISFWVGVLMCVFGIICFILPINIMLNINPFIFYSFELCIILVGAILLFTSKRYIKEKKENIKVEDNSKKYLSLIRDDEEIVMVGDFNKQLQKKIISVSCFPIFPISILFMIMGVIWFLDDNEPICIIISVVALLAYIGAKSLKKWLFSFVNDEYLVLTDKRLLLKLKWHKISLVYSKISTVSTEQFIFKSIRLVVNLGSSICISHLINDDEIAEEILKRLN